MTISSSVYDAFPYIPQEQLSDYVTNHFYKFCNSQNTCTGCRYFSCDSTAECQIAFISALLHKLNGTKSDANLLHLYKYRLIEDFVESFGDNSIVHILINHINQVAQEFEEDVRNGMYELHEGDSV